jgi:transcriptional regulator with XRE-family HTH domain
VRDHPLAHIRAKHGISAQRLAQMAGVSEGTISRIENHARVDRPTPAMKKIADALAVDVREIIAEGQVDSRGAYATVADFFDLDPASPGSRIFLDQLKASVHRV